MAQDGQLSSHLGNNQNGYLLPSTTDVLGPAGRKEHRCGTATDRTRSLSRLGLESAAELPGRTHPRPAGDKLEGTGRSLPGPTQLYFCFQREGCLRLRYFVHLTAAVRRQAQGQSLVNLMLASHLGKGLPKLTHPTPPQKVSVIKKLQIICEAYG